MSKNYYNFVLVYFSRSAAKSAKWMSTRKFRGAERSKVRRTVHTVTVANAASRYARLAHYTATYPTYSPHCNCSCRVSTPREDHRKAHHPTILVVLSTVEQRTSLTHFFFRLSISEFLVYVVHLTSLRLIILSFFLPRCDVSTNYDNICNTQDWIFMLEDSLHLSVIYLSLPY